MWLFVLCLTFADDDLRELIIPADAIERRETFRPSGSMHTKMSYSIGDELVGQRQFYADGQLGDERLYKDKKLHGIWRQWHSNGKLFAERPYREGQMDGLFRFWDEDGKLLGESEMKSGTGVLREYDHEAGFCDDRETPFVNGKMHGIRKYWGKFGGCNGIGCSLSAYKDGKLDGWEITRDEDGTLVGYSYAKEGRIHGVFRRQNRDGTAIDGYLKYFINDEEVSETRFLDAAKTDKILAVTLTYSPPRIEKIPPRDNPPTAVKDKP